MPPILQNSWYNWLDRIGDNNMSWNNTDIEEFMMQQIGVHPDPDELDEYLYPYEKDFIEYKSIGIGCYWKRKIPGG